MLRINSSWSLQHVPLFSMFTAASSVFCLLLELPMVCFLGCHGFALSMAMFTSLHMVCLALF
eukprot:m.364633 g.364633  ORF g.364633 m.364633 type:complete len:62 (-) comp27821_c0_seq1:28-213(-)